MSDLRYPIGRFVSPPAYTPAHRRELTQQLAELPAELRKAVRGLSADQLRTPYREGGWTVAQVVHHLADSHMNSYVRLRLALTESTPTIKPYDEARWAELPDARAIAIESSLGLVEHLHRRWVNLLETLTPGDFERDFIHPERGPMTIDRLVALYAWHGRHHVAHIMNLRVRQAWT